MKTSVGVIDKTVEILSLLAQKKLININTIVAETKMPKSTVHRMLSSLEAHHLVVRIDNHYTLGSRFIHFTETSSYNLLLLATEQVLAELSDLTKESTQLYIKEGKERVCIASIEPKIGLKNTVPIGAIYPLHAGSAGKVLVYYDDPKNSNEMNWIESVSEREEGVASVSAPIFNSSHRLLGAISVSGPISRLGENPGEAFGEYVVAAAEKINAKLSDKA